MEFFVTPFCNDINYELVTQSDFNNDISVKYINKMVAKGKLDNIEINIIKILGEFGILNYKLIDYLINYQSGLIESEIDYSEKILRLRKYGILNFFYKEKPEQGVYSLSQGGKIYYFLLKNYKTRRVKEENKKYLDASVVNHIVPVNSFFINLHSTNRISVKKWNVGYCSWQRYFTLKADELNYELVVGAIRRNDDILQILLDLKNKGLDFFRDNKFIIVLICEDTKHIIDLNRIIVDNITYANYKILYSTDRDSSLNALNGVYCQDRKNRYVINTYIF